MTLLGFAVVGTALLAYVFSVTRGAIAESERREKLALINQILPHEMFDNDLLEDSVELPPSGQLGTDQPTLAYRARRQGRPVAAVMEAVAPDGYSGRIRMVVAVLENGEVAGVRVVAHKETPGLGDYIEIAKGPWIRVFDGASRERYRDADWKVRKDGGRFDHMAGATITPRAVVKAVRRALEYYADNRERILAAAVSTRGTRP
ncbi:MAG: electron transport complex subunit RsxG [Betaproteobacteria bacterium]|nr:electron transport complex subunit RsxG [Betaproteobacteria bacterium]